MTRSLVAAEQQAVSFIPTRRSASCPDTALNRESKPQEQSQGKESSGADLNADKSFMLSHFGYCHSN